MTLFKEMPAPDSNAARKAIHSAFETAMLAQAGEIGPLALRQRNAIFAVAWACAESVLAAAPKEPA